MGSNYTLFTFLSKDILKSFLVLIILYSNYVQELGLGVGACGGIVILY
jgi:hypothetical protein